MKLQLKKIEEPSGTHCHIYSIAVDNDDATVFEHFLAENNELFGDEVMDIYNRIHLMGHKMGAREQFFKLNEGKPGDGVCALYDDPDKKLRLYCIRYGKVAIILGGGAEKPKSVRAWQNHPKLRTEAEFIILISELLSQAIRNKDIELSDSEGFIGNELIIDDYE